MRAKLQHKNGKFLRNLTISLCLLLALVISPLTTFAQEPNNSASPQQLANENARLKQLLADALNKLANDEDKLKAANDLIASQEAQTTAATSALNLSKLESDALRRAIAADQLAIDAYKRAYEAEQTASDAYKHRAESAEGRVDKLQDQLTKSRKHGLFATVAAFALGAIIKGF